MRIGYNDAPVGGLNGQTLTRGLLTGFRLRALRRRVWYGALDRIERGLVDLTIRYVDQVKSNKLQQVLVEILEKLTRAMKHGMARVLRVGRELALRASTLAVGWGNSQAYAWRHDRLFWRGLALKDKRTNRGCVEKDDGS